MDRPMHTDSAPDPRTPVRTMDFARMFANLPEPHAILDPALVIRHANEAFCRATLTQRERILGRHLFDAFPEDPADPDSVASVASVRRLLARAIASGQPDRVVQKYSIPGADGRHVLRYWATSVLPLVGPGGELECLVVRPEDVTDFVLRKGTVETDPVLSQMEHEVFRRSQQVQSANDQLRVEITRRCGVEHELSQAIHALSRANREIEQFSYAASHDLQSPLHTLVKCTQLLRRRLAPGDSCAATSELFDFVEQAGLRMQSLVTDLLELAEAGLGDVPRVPVPLAEIVAEARSVAGFDDDPRCPQLVLHEPLPHVRGNAVQLRHLMKSLLSNAIKFQPAGNRPRVIIDAMEAVGWCTVTVADNGIGIPANQHTAIFAGFRRLHAPSVYPGNGLGLALCRKIVEQQQGRIWVDSEPGRGSRFHFTLPLADEYAGPALLPSAA
ncbi:MAG TPA: ATP-binding protein [Candidatus Binatia bacterium]|nr:ATP-binding protein [Candidatus Binatia bacterium]